MRQQFLVSVSDPALLSRLEKQIWIGRGAVLIDATGFTEPIMQWLNDRFGPGTRGRYVLPIHQHEDFALLGFSAAPACWEEPSFVSLTSDRSIYRQGHDTVHLLALAPFAAGQRQTLRIDIEGREYARRVITLNAQGMAELTLTDLPLGNFMVSWLPPEHADRVMRYEAAMLHFSVVEYVLAPLVATLVEQVFDGDTWRFSLQLTSFGAAVNGPVHVRLLPRHDPSRSLQTLAIDGLVTGSFLLTGRDALELEVQLLADSSLTATVPILGSAAGDRQATMFSHLGRNVFGSLLPGHSSQPVRGIFLSESNHQASALELQSVVGDVAKLTATRRIECLAVHVRDPFKPATIACEHRAMLQPGETLQLPVSGMMGILHAAGFVDNEPWEGYAAMLRPGLPAPDIAWQISDAESEANTVQVTLATAATQGSAYVVVKDARLPSSTTPATNLASKLKHCVARHLGSTPTTPIDIGTFRRSLLAWGFTGDAEQPSEQIDRILELVPESVARENNVLPLSADGDELTIAISDLQDLDTIDKLRFILNCRIRCIAVPADVIAQAIDAHYGPFDPTQEMDSILQEFTDTAIDFSASDASERGMSAEQPLVGDVLFAGIVPLEQGRGVLQLAEVQPDTLYTVEAFVIENQEHDPNWCAGTREFRFEKLPSIQLQLPRGIAAADGAAALLVAKVASSSMRVELTRNGEAVALRAAGTNYVGNASLAKPAETFAFVATAGVYEGHVVDLASGKAATVRQVVEIPGKARRMSRTQRILQPGESLQVGEGGVMALRVLNGIEAPFQRLLLATGTYEHCCCEQTAAKLLAAVEMYATASNDEGQRERALALVLAGVERQNSMWLPGRGFKSYPHLPNRPDGYLGAIATTHLQLAQLLWSADDKRSEELALSGDRLRRMVEDTSAAYDRPWPPRDFASPRDAYAALACNADRTAWTEPLDWLKGMYLEDGRLTPQNGGCSVRQRTDAAFTAATLLRADSVADRELALGLASCVLQAIGPEGRLYSTLDSVAAIALMLELKRAGIGAAGPIYVNGELLTANDAVARANISTLKADGERALVEVTRIVEEDWDALPGNVRMHVSLEARSDRERMLRIELQDGYQTGDLLYVSLPPSLSRLQGGGQVKQFAVDFAGRSSLHIPLIVTGISLNAAGRPAVHHFAVCLRNMYNEQRCGNPGPISILLQA